MVKAASSGSAEMKLSVVSIGAESSPVGTDDARAVMDVGPARDGPALAFYQRVERSVTRNMVTGGGPTYPPILVLGVYERLLHVLAELGHAELLADLFAHLGHIDNFYFGLVELVLVCIGSVRVYLYL
jgi:hypothetical protein